MNIKNEKIINHPFLQEMVIDSYFPDFLANKGKTILLELCEAIESENPKTEADLLVLTHNATELFNRLDEELNENGSEIETAARECIAMDFHHIATAYGFDVDIEELIATRDW